MGCRKKTIFGKKIETPAPPPVPVKHRQVKYCKLYLSSLCVFIFSSVCLFLFCVPSPFEPPMGSETLQADFFLFIFVFMSFCLLAFFCLFSQVQVQLEWNTANSVRTDIWGKWTFVLRAINFFIWRTKKSRYANHQVLWIARKKEKLFQYNNQTTLV